MKCLEKTVDCYPQSDASDGIEQPASLFLVLYWLLCPQWSAFGKPRSVTDDAAEATDDFLFLFVCLFLYLFLLNQEHGVNNERPQSIQSVRHSKRTLDVREKAVVREMGVCGFFLRIARSWQFNT